METSGGEGKVAGKGGRRFAVVPGATLKSVGSLFVGTMPEEGKG